MFDRKRRGPWSWSGFVLCLALFWLTTPDWGPISFTIGVLGTILGADGAVQLWQSGRRTPSAVLLVWLSAAAVCLSTPIWQQHGFPTRFGADIHSHFLWDAGHVH